MAKRKTTRRKSKPRARTRTRTVTKTRTIYRTRKAARKPARRRTAKRGLIPADLKSNALTGLAAGAISVAASAFTGRLVGGLVKNDDARAVAQGMTGAGIGLGLRKLGMRKLGNYVALGSMAVTGITLAAKHLGGPIASMAAKLPAPGTGGGTAPATTTVAGPRPALRIAGPQAAGVGYVRQPDPHFGAPF